MVVQSSYEVWNYELSKQKKREEQQAISVPFRKYFFEFSLFFKKKIIHEKNCCSLLDEHSRHTFFPQYMQEVCHYWEPHSFITLLGNDFGWKGPSSSNPLLQSRLSPARSGCLGPQPHLEHFHRFKTNFFFLTIESLTLSL